MAHPRVLALGYSEAAMLLRQPGAAGVGAIISIHGQREFAVEAQVARRLDLHFDDMDAPDPADPVSAYRSLARQRQAAEDGLHQTPPTIDDARAIIEFAATIKDMEGVLLCHCGAGISRSPAAALLCLAAWAGPGREQEGADVLLRIRPSAVPHRDLIRFGDELLRRRGRLVQAAAYAQQRDH